MLPVTCHSNTHPKVCCHWCDSYVTVSWYRIGMGNIVLFARIAKRFPRSKPTFKLWCLYVVMVVPGPLGRGSCDSDCDYRAWGTKWRTLLWSKAAWWAPELAQLYLGHHAALLHRKAPSSAGYISAEQSESQRPRPSWTAIQVTLYESSNLFTSCPFLFCCFTCFWSVLCIRQPTFATTHSALQKAQRQMQLPPLFTWLESATAREQIQCSVLTSSSAAGRESVWWKQQWWRSGTVRAGGGAWVMLKYKNYDFE